MDMVKGYFKWLIVSVVIMISGYVTSVGARSLSCSYDITYTGYSNSEEKIQLVISDDNDKLHESWSVINADSNNPLNNINNKSNYINKLELDDFKDGDNFVCPKINYTIVKDNNNGFRVYVGNSDAGYLNTIQPSSNNSDNTTNDETIGDNSANNSTDNSQNNNSTDTTTNNGNNDTVNDNTNPTSSPSPSSTDTLEKIEWEKIGEDADATCEDTMGDLVDELQKYFDMIKIIAPILLMVFGAIDFAGATVGMNNKDAMAKTTSKFIRRCIAALAIFFLPTLIEVVFTLPGLPSIEDVLCGLK